MLIFTLKMNLQLRNLSKACRSSPQRLAQFKEGLQENTTIAFELFGDPFDANPDVIVEKDACKRALLPLRDVPTRWNATYYMADRSMAIRKGLEEVTDQNRELRDLELSDPEWTQVKEAVEFLEPFALTTKHIEAFKYPTLVSFRCTTNSWKIWKIGRVIEGTRKNQERGLMLLAIS